MNVQHIIDSLAAIPAFRAEFRNDVQSGIYAKQLVTQTLAELFRFEYPETKWASGRLMSLFTGVSEGALEYSYLEMDHSGRAEFVADNATDLPAMEIAGRNNLRRIKTLGGYVTYSTQDIRTSQLQGRFDIATEKAQAARMGFDRKVDDLIRTGDAAAGFEGFTNHSGIIVASAVNGSWASAAAADIVEDFCTAQSLIVNGSDGVEVPDTAVFPIAIWERISCLQNSVASDISVLEYLQRARPNITRWEWDFGMATAGAAGAPAVMMYNRQPRKVRSVMPMAMRAMPVVQQGLSFKLNFEARWGGIMMPKPRSALRLDGV